MPIAVGRAWAIAVASCAAGCSPDARSGVWAGVGGARWLVVLLLGVAVLAACGTSAPAPTPAPAPPLAAAPSAAPPTTVPTASPTAATAPSPTPEGPTATPGFPTALPPSPTSAPNPAATIGALNAAFPASGYDFRYRPLAFQIDNAPEARPQTALSHAYVVYETIAEGGITRFTALFVRNAEPKVGNLRSARLVDLDIVPQWDAFLVHVGASTQVTEQLRAAKLPEIDLDDARLRRWSWRTQDRLAPYNLYTSIDLVRRYLQSVSAASTTIAPRAFPVGALPPGGASGVQVDVPYEGAQFVRYQYATQGNAYLRWTGGRQDVDALDGQPLRVSNVVVMYAEEHETDIIENEEGGRSLQYTLVGDGKALIARNGRAFPAQWHRHARDELTTFTGEGGTAVPFAPGNVWIEIVPTTSAAIAR